MQKKQKKTFLLFIPVFIFLAGASYLFFQRRKTKYAPLSVVPYVDLKRYCGIWYDIAHLPAIFLKGCYNTKAEYSLNENGSIHVVNTCNKGSIYGEKIDAEGTAVVKDVKTNAKLKVEFFWPFKGDYWILELDKDYEYALVGEPSRKYLWVLSRNPSLDENIMKRLIDVANEQGFSTNNLIMTKHHL